MSLAIPVPASAETANSAQNLNIDNSNEKMEVKSETFKSIMRYAGPQINIETVEIEKPIYTIKYAGPEMRNDFPPPRKIERPIYTVKYAAPIRPEVQYIEPIKQDKTQETTKETKQGFFYPLYKFFHRNEK